LNSSVHNYLKTAVPGTSNRSYSNFAVQKIELKNKKATRKKISEDYSVEQFVGKKLTKVNFILFVEESAASEFHLIIFSITFGQELTIL
jgi:hypothetical protein